MWGDAGLGGWAGERHQQAAGNPGQAAPGHQPDEAAIPGAGGQGEHHQRHAEVERCRDPETAGDGAAAQGAEKVAGQGGGAEQAAAAAVDPASVDHGREDRHIGEPGQAISGAGCRSTS